jgi:hypothetical protein
MMFDPYVLKEVASRHMALAGLHHLALFAILVVVWARRSVASRVLAVYFTVAFATAAFSLFSDSGTIPQALVAVALAMLWCIEGVRGRIALAFAATPRLRLVAMACAGAFALNYPGYSEGLPSFIFSPVGVILEPTLLAAVALLNASCRPARGPLHWSLAVAGLAVGAVGLAVDGWAHVPLVIASAYAVPLLLGRGRFRPGSAAPDASSVREIRDRMYSRRSMLPGPRDTRRPGRTVHIRRRR